MIISDQLLPTAPSYQQACQLIDNSTDDHWLPVLETLRKHHQLAPGKWCRITEGANILFKLDDQFIIKLVPPNWQYQGTAEIESSRLLAGKLSIAIPEIIASDTVNNWVYVIMTLLPGQSLADIWSDLSTEQKHPLIRQLGLFIRALHQLPIDTNSSLSVDWQSYIQQLRDDCVPRHQRKSVPSQLVEQIPAYLSQADKYFDDGESFFIHMDLHPWNLMVEQLNGEYQISGVIDFGDAIIGRSRILELNTPILFMCQGNKALVATLMNAYGLMEASDRPQLQLDFMANALLRPACDFNFVLQQVPETGPRDNWQQIAAQLFPFG